MGAMIRLTCKACDFEREAHVGVGMLGIGTELCPCYHCKRFVTKKVDHRNFSEVATLKCPYCRKEIEPFEEGDSCAVCGGKVLYELIGLWD
jgi:hypothetical protein